jgi:hypothetical protein
MCRTLQQKSYQALSDPLQITQTGPLANQFDVESWCRERLEAVSFGDSLSFSDNLKDLFQINQNMMGDEARSHTEMCFMCHGKEGFSKFPGMDKLSLGQSWTDDAWQEFQAALRGETGNRQFPLGPKVLNKMLLNLMPPGGWLMGNDARSIAAEDRRRREFLANYVKLTMVTSNNEESIVNYCRSIVREEQSDTTAPGQVQGTPGSAVER